MIDYHLLKTNLDAVLKAITPPCPPQVDPKYWYKAETRFSADYHEDPYFECDNTYLMFEEQDETLTLSEAVHWPGNRWEPPSTDFNDLITWSGKQEAFRYYEIALKFGEQVARVRMNQALDNLADMAEYRHLEMMKQECILNGGGESW